MIALARFIWRNSPLKVRRYLTNLASVTLPQPNDIRPTLEDPVFIIGLFQTTTGLGEGARLYYEELRQQGRRVRAIDLTEAIGMPSVDGVFKEELFALWDCPNLQEKGTLIIHINPPLFLSALHIARHVLSNKRIIGLWLWELENIPSFWEPSLALVDEVICPSVFIAEAVRKCTSKPVRVHHYILPKVVPSSRVFAEDGVVRVLYVFDLASNFYRKNPLAAIAAFREAFGGSSQAELVLKIGSVIRFQKEWQYLQEAVAGMTNIRFITDRLSQDELRELYCTSDIYLSLHRSEGYGLTIHEAMLYGLEIVATGWSGNMDFMHGPKCHAVPYHLIEVIDPLNNFSDQKKQRWADADIYEASKVLKEIAGKTSGC